MLKRNKRISIVAAITVAIGLFTFHLLYSSTDLLAAPPAGYSDIKTAKNINVVSSAGSEMEILGDYGFMFKLTDLVTYEPFGELASATVSAYTNSKSKVYQFGKDATNAQGMWIRNAGVYNGKMVDLKFVVDELNFKKKSNGQFPVFRFFAIDSSEKSSTTDLYGKTWGEYFLLVGSDNYKHYEEFSTGDKAFYHYEFYDHESGQALNLKGTWNFNNINIYKNASIPFVEPDYSSMFVRDISDIGYKHDAGTFKMSSDSIEVNEPNGRLTHLFDLNKYEVEMEYKGDGYSGPMGIMYSTESIARIAPATPIMLADKNSAVHTDNEYQKMYYTILQSVADNTKENRNTTFELNTEVPSYYDIESVKVNAYGMTADLTTLFNVNGEGSSKVTMKAKDPTSDAFNGQVFEIKVIAKPNNTFSFDKNAYGYQSSGDDNGYMTFELGGPKTNAVYTYKDKFNGTLESRVVDGQSKAKVLYEGVPSADAKSNVTVPIGTNFETDYPNPDTAFLENIKVDTENSIDEPVIVSYKKPLPSTSVLGEVTLWLTLTTAKNVTRDVPVKVNIGATAADLTIKFKINGEYLPEFPDIVESHMINDLVDLTKDQAVLDRIEEIKNKGYDYTKPADNEGGITIPLGGTTAIYEFTGKLFLKSVPESLDFQTQGYSETLSDLTVDNPSFVKPLVITDTRKTKKQWTLTAKITTPLTNVDDTNYVLNNAIRYKEGSLVTTLDGNAKDIASDTNAAATADYSVSDTFWKNGNGFVLELPAGSVNKLGKYRGVILFELGDTR